MIQIDKIPFNQRLVLGKILLVLVIPFILLIILIDNMCKSSMYFFDCIRCDFKHEFRYFGEYITMKGK